MRRFFGASRPSLLAATLIACASCSGNDGAFNWSSRASLPVPRTELGVATVGGKIYAMGGSSGSTLARVDAYDPTTNNWTQKASMHQARRSFATAVINGKIYVGPGLSWTDPNAVTYVTATEMYDPASDTWTDLAPCPYISAPNQVWGNLFFAGSAVNGRFYVVAVGTSTSSTYVYDPGTDTWTTKASGPNSFSLVAATTLGSTLYAFASPTEDVSGKLASYDPAADAWTVAVGLPGYSRSAFVAANGKLYSLGGVTGTSISSPLLATSVVYEFDPATQAWTRLGAMNEPRQHAGAVELGGHLYVIGGDAAGPGTGLVGPPSAAVEEGVPR